ncbi:MAG: AMP-binding protein [Proteobacteria bacterium]|nr:AMP-binding protein [Pseudomonadota bacterium]
MMPAIWAGHARQRAHEPAVLCEGGVLRWGELGARMAQVGNGLRALGLQSGDRVGLLMANDLAYVEALLGVMAAGLVAVPLNPGVADAALDAMLEDAAVSALFATQEHASRLTAAAAIRPGARLCAEGAGPEGWTAYEPWRDAQDATLGLCEVEASACCNIIYSSGTTGTPKGIAHTHGQRLAWTRDLASALRYRGGCRTLVITGLHSNITWAGMLPTLLQGGRLVVQRGFDAHDVPALVQAHGITNFSAAPVQFQRILEAGGLDQAETGSIVGLMCCGSPLPEAVKRAWIARFPHGFIELYGSTEGVITTLEPEAAEGRMRSVGRGLPGSETVILDDADRPVAAGEAGEVAQRTPWMMAGYWNRPEATREAMWRDGEGRPWLRTGDIGRLDADGFLYVVDRKKDMILSGGQNVYPADIEAVLADHPAVAECAVIGAPDPKWGETPVALVVARAGAACEAEALKAWVNGRVGKFQRVSAVRLVDALPRNAAGKVLKRELRDALAAEAAG